MSSQALKHGCFVLNGQEMFILQGLAQFEIWTGRVNATLPEMLDRIIAHFNRNL